jgi:hypothetical protein
VYMCQNLDRHICEYCSFKRTGHFQHIDIYSCDVKFSTVNCPKNGYGAYCELTRQSAYGFCFVRENNKIVFLLLFELFLSVQM